MIHFTNREVITTLIYVHVLYCTYQAYIHYRATIFISNINRYDIKIENPLISDFSFRPRWAGGKKVKNLDEKKQAKIIDASIRMKEGLDSLISFINPRFVFVGLPFLMFIGNLMGLSYAIDLKDFIKKIFSKERKVKE